MSASSSYDVFLSHARQDTAWAQRLDDELRTLGLRVFRDKAVIQPGDKILLTLSPAIRDSRFLVLVLSSRSPDRAWSKKDGSAFMVRHGAIGHILTVVLEPTETPTILESLPTLDATHRDATQVARELLELVGLPEELAADADPLACADDRSLYLGQDLVFVVEGRGERLRVTDPAGRSREVESPWRDNSFRVAQLGFSWASRERLNTAESQELHRHAAVLGEFLFDFLFDAEALHLYEGATQPRRPRPLLTLQCDDDLLLSLPWELLRHDHSFLVRDGKLDLARSALGRVGPRALLGPPGDSFKLVVNVSAPRGSRLSYEGESYRITQVLSERCEYLPTELGTLEDLVETVRRSRPTGIHFSGHGAPGALQFEDDEGNAAWVPIDKLVKELGRGLEGSLPLFFYLASCYGNQPGPQPKASAAEKEEPRSESSAARLHRGGVAQVVGYYGPINDELSTRAEVALYQALAEGRSTRHAVARARRALAPLGGAPSSHPMAWAQLVLFHRGPDRPLVKPPARARRRPLSPVLHRTFEGTDQRKVLATGFIGRRPEVHRVRRRIRRGDRVFVFQGLGGLGKSSLAFHVLPLLAEPENTATLWCHEVEAHADLAEALVLQLLRYCQDRLGPAWKEVVEEVDRTAGDDSARRFELFLQALLEKLPRLVLYLDNLESLLAGPKEARGNDARDEKPLGEWRTESLAQIWRGLDRTTREGDKLFLVASCRYRHPDFTAALLPVSPLPDDALYRLMAWFPALRRLAAPTRRRLVARLAGHPRAVELADDLVGDALKGHRDWCLPAEPEWGDLEREWELLVDPALGGVRDKLSDDLLLDQIWKRILDERSRRMLYRMTLLRRPWAWGLHSCLGEADEPEDRALATAEALSRTSLLEEMELGGEHRFTLHPTITQLVSERFEDDEAIRRTAHRRIGEWLDADDPAAGEQEIGAALEAGHHLFQAGQIDRAGHILHPACNCLQEHGRVREGLQALKPFLPEAVWRTMKPQIAGRLVGNAANAHHRLGEVDKAIGYYEQRLGIGCEIGDRQGKGDGLMGMGLVYADLGEVEKAIEYFEQSLVIRREIGDGEDLANSLGNLGNAYLLLGETEKGIEYLDQALVIGRKIGDRHGVGNRLGNLGSAYCSLGEAEKAIGYLDQALVISRETGDLKGEGGALTNLGIAYNSLNQVEKAIELYDQALVISRKIGDPRGEGSVLTNLALAYVGLGEVEKAIRYFERALWIGREIKDLRMISVGANIYGDLGRLYQTRGEPRKAEQVHRKALDLNKELGRKEGMADAYGSLALIYQTWGELEQAEQMHRKCLAIEKELGRKEEVANAYGNLGEIYRTRGELEQAEQMHRKALVIDEELERREGMANAYGNLGLIHQARGNLDQAEQMYRKSFALNEELGRKEGMANAYGNLGLIHQARGNLDQAEEMLRKALAFNQELSRKEGMAIQYGNLGMIYQLRHDLDQAERMHRKSLAIEEELGRKEGMAADYGNLGGIYRARGDLDQARTWWLKSRDLYVKIGVPHMVEQLEGWLEELAAEHLEKTAESEQVAKSGILGRPPVMARAAKIRAPAAEKLKGWTHARFEAGMAEGDRLVAAGRHTEAVAAIQAVVQKAVAAGEDAYEEAGFDLADAYYSLARALRLGGDSRAALAPLDEAGKRFRSSGAAGHQDAARMSSVCLSDKGQCLMALGRLDKAAQAYEAAVKLDEKRDDSRAVGVDKGRLGTARMYQKRYNEALTLHHEARQIAETLQDPGSTATSWHQIGRVHEEAGDYNASEEAYLKAIGFRVQMGDASGEAGTLNQLGNLRRWQGRPEDAIRLLKRAAAIFVDLGNLASEGRTRGNLAGALLESGRHKEAHREMRRAIKCQKLFGSTGRRWVARIGVRLSSLLFRLISLVRPGAGGG